MPWQRRIAYGTWINRYMIFPCNSSRCRRKKMNTNSRDVRLCILSGIHCGNIYTHVTPYFVWLRMKLEWWWTTRTRRQFCRTPSILWPLYVIHCYHDIWEYSSTQGYCNPQSGRRVLTTHGNAGVVLTDGDALASSREGCLVLRVPFWRSESSLWCCGCIHCHLH